MLPMRMREGSTRNRKTPQKLRKSDLRRKQLMRLKESKPKKMLLKLKRRK